VHQQPPPEDLLQAGVELTRPAHAKRLPLSVSGIRGSTYDVDIGPLFKDRDLVGEPIRVHEVVGVHASDQRAPRYGSNLVQSAGQPFVTTVRQ
jgi:hypothetical protein